MLDQFLLKQSDKYLLTAKSTPHYSCWQLNIYSFPLFSISSLPFQPFYPHINILTHIFQLKQLWKSQDGQHVTIQNPPKITMTEDLVSFPALLKVITCSINETSPHVHRWGVRKAQQRVDLCPLTNWKQEQTSVTHYCYPFSTFFPSAVLFVPPHCHSVYTLLIAIIGK